MPRKHAGLANGRPALPAPTWHDLARPACVRGKGKALIRAIYSNTPTRALLNKGLLYDSSIMVACLSREPPSFLSIVLLADQRVVVSSASG